MYAGRIACCPLVSYGDYADGTDGQTDYITPDRYITRSAMGVSGAIMIASIRRSFKLLYAIVTNRKRPVFGAHSYTKLVELTVRFYAPEARTDLSRSDTLCLPVGTPHLCKTPSAECSTVVDQLQIRAILPRKTRIANGLT